MTLSDYIISEGRGSLTRLAAAVGTSKGYLHDLCNDPNRRPSIELAKKLELATGGKVTALGLLGLDPPKKTEAA
jgi:hypothetical protein